MRRARQREASGGARRPIAYTVLLAAVALIVLAHWPGRLDSDSTATIAQVHDGFISDQRSAVLTWVWRQAYRVVGLGPGVVLTVQILVLAAGLYLVLRSVFGRIAAAVLAAALLFAPPTFGFVGLVGRDAWFASCTLLAAGLCVTAARLAGRARAVGIGAGLVACAIAVFARQNGFTAVFPIVVALALVALPLARRRLRHGALVAICAGVAVTAAFVGLNAGLTDAVRDATDHPRVYTEIYDLGYLTEHLHRRFIPSLPQAMQPTQTIAEVQQRWTPTTSIYMRWDPTRNFAPGSGPQPYDDAAAKRLGHSWRTAIVHHPIAYLEGRLGLWKRQLGIGATPAYAMAPTATPNPWGYDRPAVPWLSRLAARYAHHWGAAAGSLTGGPLHHVWPYLLCCLALLPLLLRRRLPADVRAVVVLPAAAVGLQAGLFLLAPSVQLRYELLTIYAALAGLCVAAGAHRAALGGVRRTASAA